MDLALVELAGVTMGSGVVTGAVTVAGLRVHIQYLREQFVHHRAETDAAKIRITETERDVAILKISNERANSRISELRAAL
jgi:hypothetical protein